MTTVRALTMSYRRSPAKIHGLALLHQYYRVCFSMSKKLPYARIAITLPHNDLAAADRLAAQHDRSRSWIVAEAIRRYAAEEEEEAGTSASPLGKSRTIQLRADAGLSPNQRVAEADEVATVGPPPGAITAPRMFNSFDAFLAWRRTRA